MSNSLPERPSMRQLRILAKELLKAAQSGDATALAELSPKSGIPKLADAQFAAAKRYGAKNWSQLVEEVEVPELIRTMSTLIESEETAKLDRLLTKNPRLRAHVDDEVFVFNQTPVMQAARKRRAGELLSVLVKHGANPNKRSGWWAGGFSALDHSSPEATEALLALGATFDIWSASAKGRIDLVREFLDRDPSLVSARGGDGKTPIHFASTPEVAQLLIERGADLEIRDIDHESSPIQYQVNEKEIVRRLLAAGAEPDVFTAAVLDDPAILSQVLAKDPEAKLSRVGKVPFKSVHSDGGHIYEYQLGVNKTPQVVAAERGSHLVFDLLVQGIPTARRLLAIAWTGQRAAFDRARIGTPGRLTLEPEDQGLIAEAARLCKPQPIPFLLELGLDPMTPGMDSGTSLHVAAWMGCPEIVELLLDKVPLDTLDAHHGSPPLGWALHGANNCWRAGADHKRVVEMLISAGAPLTTPGNRYGATLADMAGRRKDLAAMVHR